MLRVRPIPLLLLLALPLGGCLERAKASLDDQALAVQAVRVVAAPATRARDYAGVIKPRREADLAFRAGGRLATRLVDLGAVVRQGEVLARLDPADLALSVRSAEAALAGAEAAAAQTAADASRSRTLRGDGWTAAATDELKQSAARQAEQAVQSARAALALARNRLGYGELRAPADGVVTAVLADPGTVLAEGAPVLRLAEAGAMELEAQMPETALPHLAEQASLTLWAQPGIALPVRLREVAPMATGPLRTYTARFTLLEQPAWLALGMSATLRLAEPAPAGLAEVPAAAVADRGQGPIVWIIPAAPADGAPTGIAARSVTVASLRQNSALVAGLRPGELVVAMGVQKLDPAARVRVVDILPARE